MKKSYLLGSLFLAALLGVAEHALVCALELLHELFWKIKKKKTGKVSLNMDKFTATARGNMILHRDAPALYM